MKLVRCVRVTLVTLACGTWIFPASAAQPAAGAAPLPTAFCDVRLSDDGTLHGQWLDAHGAAVAQQTVVLCQGTRALAETRTDAAGRFAFLRIRGGIYQITNGSTAVACRVWTGSAAPPAALQQVLVTDRADVVRGAQPISALFTNPLVIGLIIAAAVAIPLAVHKNQQEQASGS